MFFMLYSLCLSDPPSLKSVQNSNYGVYRYSSALYSVSNFKPYYILPLPNGMVAHAIKRTVLMSGPSTPQKPNLSSYMEVTI